MRIFPEKYEELDIDKYDKQLMATVKKIYRDDELATFMLCCNPSKTKDGIVDILITETGVLCIKLLSDVTDDNLMPKLFERQLQQKKELEIITDRMKLHKALLASGEIKYAVKIISVFPLCKRPTLPENAAMKEFNDFVEKNCYFSDFLSRAMKERDFVDRMLAYARKFKITEDSLPDVVNRLTPEYTIPQKKAAIDVNKLHQSTSRLIDEAVSNEDRAALAWV